MSEDQVEAGRWEGFREVVTMAWPIMLGAVSFTVMDFADKVFVSMLGQEHLAAIGSAGIWSFTMGVFFLGITSCVSTFVSQSLGQGRRENCACYAWQGIYIALVAGSLSIAMWPIAPSLFHVMGQSSSGGFGHTPEVIDLEVVYFRIRLLGFTFIAWQSCLASFFQAISRPIVPMCVALFANLANIGLDWLLIFPHGSFPGWGIAGAAWATVISLATQATLLQCMFASGRVHAEYGSRSGHRFDWGKAKELFRIGWPAGVSSFLDIAGWGIFISFIIGGFGTMQLAANTAALNFMHLMFIPVSALNQATAPIVGRWIGLGEIATAKARAYTATKIGVCLMLSVGIMLSLSGGLLMRVFSQDPEVIALGGTLLRFAATFAGFDAITIVLSGALRGAGDTRWTMWTFSIGSYFVLLPLAYFFAVVLGLEAKGGWIGVTLYAMLLSGAFLWRFHSEAWRHIDIFSETAPQNSRPEPEDAEIEPAE
ncbi:MAG: MATE family efflux transporter [Candidatus Hydrogenedentes bacterium]|nr:MATE family efflux transporter [Candidatus Hydrogenedentota bacterium]